MARKPYLTFADVCRYAAIWKDKAENNGEYSAYYDIVVLFIADAFNCTTEQVENEISFWE